MLVFTGGFTSLSRFNYYYKNAEKLLHMAMKANDKGDYFPVHGTCLGLQLLATIICKEPKSALVEETNSMGYASTLKFASTAAMNKSLFERMPRTLVEYLTTYKITAENHAYGLIPGLVAANSKLEEFFEVLTTSADRQGKEYVSTMAAYNYPITATQWHPEKPPFEFFSALNVPHSTRAVEVSTAVTAFFMREARKSLHYPPREEVVRMAVDNYKFEYQAALPSHDYDALYIFPTRKERQRRTSEQQQGVASS